MEAFPESSQRHFREYSTDLEQDGPAVFTRNRVRLGALPKRATDFACYQTTFRNCESIPFRFMIREHRLFLIAF
jgi:hypothetical protein